MGPKEKKTLEIMRLPGKPSQDKLTVQFIDAKEDEEPSTPFKAGCVVQSLDISVDAAWEFTEKSRCFCKKFFEK